DVDLGRLRLATAAPGDVALAARVRVHGLRPGYLAHDPLRRLILRPSKPYRTDRLRVPGSSRQPPRHMVVGRARLDAGTHRACSGSPALSERLRRHGRGHGSWRAAAAHVANGKRGLQRRDVEVPRW